ncbi:MAG: hypothetical protein WAK70_06755 [Candidatus Sulfotelmatobacter sp.]
MPYPGTVLIGGEPARSQVVVVASRLAPRYSDELARLYERERQRDNGNRARRLSDYAGRHGLELVSELAGIAIDHGALAGILPVLLRRQSRFTPNRRVST